MNTGIIQHWKLLGAQAIVILSQSLGRVAIEATSGRKIGLLCCDANIPPIEAVSLLLLAARAGILAPDARFVLTLKNTCQNQAEWKRARNSCLDALGKRYAPFSEEELRLEYESLKDGNEKNRQSLDYLAKEQTNENATLKTIEFAEFAFVHLLANTKKEGCISGICRFG